MDQEFIIKLTDIHFKDKSDNYKRLIELNNKSNIKRVFRKEHRSQENNKKENNSKSIIYNWDSRIF